jgi:hypothetical protein
METLQDVLQDLHNLRDTYRYGYASDIGKLIPILATTITSMFNNTYSIEVKKTTCSEQKYSHWYSVPHNNKYINVYNILSLKDPSGNLLTIKLCNNSVYVDLDSSSKFYNFSGSMNYFFNRHRQTFYEILKPSLDKIIEEEFKPRIEKYKKNKKAREVLFEKNAPTLALQSIVNHISDNKLNFTGDQIKVLLPILINNNKDLLSLTWWVDKNKKLKDKIDADMIDKIIDNLVIKDILE